MSIIKSIDTKGREQMNIQPNSETFSTVQYLMAKGHSNIHDAETGEILALDECIECGCRSAHTHE